MARNPYKIEGPGPATYRMTETGSLALAYLDARQAQVRDLAEKPFQVSGHGRRLEQTTRNLIQTTLPDVNAVFFIITEMMVEATVFQAFSVHEEVLREVASNNRPSAIITINHEVHKFLQAHFADQLQGVLISKNRVRLNSQVANFFLELIDRLGSVVATITATQHSSEQPAVLVQHERDDSVIDFILHEALGSLERKAQKPTNTDEITIMTLAAQRRGAQLIRVAKSFARSRQWKIEAQGTRVSLVFVFPATSRMLNANEIVYAISELEKILNSGF